MIFFRHYPRVGMTKLCSTTAMPAATEPSQVLGQLGTRREGDLGLHLANIGVERRTDALAGARLATTADEMGT